ncbi:MAG: flagellar hook protein FlgE [Magnetococcales bacterium]|nr:flagellar hook protein FlgE [Magnetococcales bacterium]
MSITQAMYSGSSALTNYGNAMTVIGNNLANANTTAFKGSRTTFEDVLIQTVGISGTRSATQIGTGVGLSAIGQDMNQGSLNGTTNVTDLSIDGRGFFQVRGNASVGSTETAVTSSDTYYTRAGDFKKNSAGQLVTNAGLVLQGWKLGEDGSTTGQTQDIDMDVFQTSSPQATTRVEVGMNLDADTPINTATYDPDNPSTYDHATTVRVYDSLGNGHNLEVHFKKTADNTWAWHVAAPTEDLVEADQAADQSLTAVDQITTNVKAAAGTGYTAGTLVFDNLGRLSQEGSTPITFNFSGNDSTAAAQEILFDFGGALGTNGDSTNDFTKASDAVLTYGIGTEVADEGNSGVNRTVQRADDFATLSLDKNGFPTGYLESLAISQDGKIYGNYSNGDNKALYQIALVDFDNQLALEQIGANLFAETHLSGEPRLGQAQSGSLGAIKSYSLEQSNVDMSAEFVTMITVQRAFQANSRIVTVTDGMLEELISLKR